MASFDLRQSINAISDVINNRPRPLREFDQIFMKTADMLLQAEHISHHLYDKNVVFIGDGDAISLCLVHLHQLKILEHGPRHVHILDFDERIINSILNFAQRYKIEKYISAELYNVVDPLPHSHISQYDAFYTNPPFGASNGGRSIEAFLKRALECLQSNAVGCIVIADYPQLDWTKQILLTTQQLLIQKEFYISELIPSFHKYHLDDTPELTSCSMVIKRLLNTTTNLSSKSEKLPQEFIENFYGKNSPLSAHYIRDRTNGGKLSSQDYYIDKL